MKTLKIRFSLLVLSFMLFMNMTCKKQEEASCGCNGPVESVIEAEQAQTGLLMKRPDFTKYPDDQLSSLNFTYSIGQCHGNMCSTFIICNDKALVNLGDIPAEGIMVSFSGQVKTLCDPPVNPPEYSFRRISLTGISKVEP